MKSLLMTPAIGRIGRGEWGGEAAVLLGIQVLDDSIQFQLSPASAMLPSTLFKSSIGGLNKAFGIYKGSQGHRPQAWARSISLPLSLNIRSYSNINVTESSINQQYASVTTPYLYNSSSYRSFKTSTILKQEQANADSSEQRDGVEVTEDAEVPESVTVDGENHDGQVTQGETMDPDFIQGIVTRYPNIYTLNSQLGNLLSKDRFEQAVAVLHAAEQSKHYIFNNATFVSWLRAHMGLGQFEAAEALWDKAAQADMLSIALVNAFIENYGKRKMWIQAEAIYKKMFEHSLAPTELTYCLLMKSFFHGNQNDRAIDLMRDIKSRDPGCIGSNLLNTYGLILVYARRSEMMNEFCLEVDKLPPSALKEDVGYYVSLLMRLAWRGDYLGVSRTIEKMYKLRLNISTKHCVAIVATFCAGGKVHHADRFIHYIAKTDLVKIKKLTSINLKSLYRVLLVECINSKDVDVAQRAYEAMMEINSGQSIQGLEFDVHCLIRLFLSRNEEQSALQILDYYTSNLKQGEHLTVSIFREIVNFYLELNSPHIALKLWNRYSGFVRASSNKTLISFGILAAAGKTREAAALFDEIIQAGIPPSPDICVSILSAYVNHGDFKKATFLFEEFKENGITPNTDMYNVFAGYHSGRGDWSKIKDLLSSMETASCTPNAETWGLLVEAMVIAENYEQALQEFDAHFSSADPLPENMFRPTVEDCSAVLHACHGLGNTTKLAGYWNMMMSTDQSLRIHHFLPALHASTSNKPLFFSIIVQLAKSMVKSSFPITQDESKALVRIIRNGFLTPSSPLYNELEKFNVGGAQCLKWDGRKDWSAFLAKFANSQVTMV